MNTTTIAAAPHGTRPPVAPLVDDLPRYRHVGGGTFKPANDAAWREVAAFNAWVDEVNSRTARSLDQ